MGFTAEAMSKSIESLGYRVVDTVKALHLFGPGEAVKDYKSLEKASNAGRKLAKTIKLKDEIKSRLQNGTIL